MTNENLRVGLVGCGYWGSKHLRVLNELPGCDIAALCEPTIQNILRQPKAFLPPVVTADYDTFLAADLDAVVIATPARTHYALVMQASSHSKAVRRPKGLQVN